MKKGIGGPRRGIHETISSGGFREARDGVSYARAMEARGGRKTEPFRKWAAFTTHGGEKIRLAKAYVGKVLNLGSFYNMHVQFGVEGIFSIKVTPMSANLCLLEEVEEGFIFDLIGEGST